MLGFIFLFLQEVVQEMLIGPNTNQEKIHQQSYPAKQYNTKDVHRHTQNIPGEEYQIQWILPQVP